MTYSYIFLSNDETASETHIFRSYTMKDNPSWTLCWLELVQTENWALCNSQNTERIAVATLTWAFWLFWEWVEAVWNSWEQADPTSHHHNSYYADT